ncbi:hypothetical protein [Streptomyces sp. DH-12]|uniref:hypothetical protein n=1 Tax=Streptomyces sp. DH-12 TaxID=2072509 RepID=UPI00313AC7B0
MSAGLLRAQPRTVPKRMSYAVPGCSAPGIRSASAVIPARLGRDPRPSRPVEPPERLDHQGVVVQAPQSRQEAVHEQGAVGMFPCRCRPFGSGGTTRVRSV